MKKIPLAKPDLSGNEIKYVNEVIAKQGRISSSGYYLDKFEGMAARRFKRKFALSCSNGTTALHLALLSLGIGPGDEVIVPTMTFAACAAAIVYCGARPVFIDSNLQDWTIDVLQLDAKKTSRTRAVLAVDLYGMPANYDILPAWCKKNKIYLIEDAAEAHGACFAGKPVGSFGQVSCFSFYGNKVLTTGEGGVCLTDDKALYNRMKVLKNHGMRSAGLYDHDIVGFNYRLTNLQAAIGCAQFERFNEFLAKREQLDRWYHEFLGGTEEIIFQKYDQKKISPVCWLFSCVVKKNSQLIRSKLTGKGIENRAFFKPLHLQKPYKRYCLNQKFPKAEYLYKHGLTLPAFIDLTKREIKRISDYLLASF
ncbi:MAG: DegT/DnrJ/EryC1/StrS family aminotransferase [bacterium]|nr:DegT/DnrJ/EryC1/StrS family aminotransferase [bacterium]